MKTLEQFYLGKLAEEAAEIAQIALKTDQFGMDEKHPAMTQTNKERIHAEINDLLAVVDELTSVRTLLNAQNKAGFLCGGVS